MDYYDDPMTLFKDALPNLTTREKYQRRLAQFFNFMELKGNLESQAKSFVSKSQKDPRWTVSVIMKYLRHQKERVEKSEISIATLPNYYKPIKLFCDMNDLTLNWKKITRTLPKGKTRATDRIPTKEEIKKLLEYPDRRIKPAILTMLSSGIRVGAWDYLRWNDVEPIQNDNEVIAAKLTVYRGEPEEYITFITPEAFDALTDYKEFRESHGEKITPKSWLLRDDFNVTTKTKGTAYLPKQLKSSGLKRMIERALWAQGIRKQLEKGKKRHEFQADHGFRKFFKTYGERKMKSLHVEMLMGHSTGLSDNYYRIPEDELLSDYQKAINDLSIYSFETKKDEKIKNIEDELMRVKFDVLGLLKQLQDNGLIKPKNIQTDFMALQKHFRIEKEGIIVKDTDGSEILF